MKRKISASLKGRVPWNKGLSMSDVTRERMRQSKLGTAHSLKTKRKMSMSHTGKSHSAETMKRLSQRLSGIPKSSEHKRKISIAQKKRHATNRALSAIEKAHKLAGTIYGQEHSPPPTRLNPYFSQSINRKKYSREKKTRAEVHLGASEDLNGVQVLKMYKALLRDYRRLQSELSPWMQAFEAKNGEKPRLRDVEATQITWLVSNFKNYLLLRDKLLRDIPFLRTAMVEAPNQAALPESLLTSQTNSPGQMPSIAKCESLDEVTASPPISPGDWSCPDVIG